MEKLFVYGTLQDEEVQILLIGRRVQGTVDVLNGYQIDASLLPPYPVAIPDTSGVIKGRVLLVSSDELAKLDAYEGEHYIRLCVELVSGQESWIYVGNPASFPTATN